ncbi:hypothetical protein STEG23_008950 [Scotinomys teguina]
MQPGRTTNTGGRTMEVKAAAPRCQLLLRARTSSTILNKYGESRQLCLVPDFSGIALSFSPFNLMVAVGLRVHSDVLFHSYQNQFSVWLILMS